MCSGQPCCVHTYTWNNRGYSYIQTYIHMHIMIIKAIHTFVHTYIHMHAMIIKKKRLSAWRGHQRGPIEGGWSSWRGKRNDIIVFHLKCIRKKKLAPCTRNSQKGWVLTLTPRSEGCSTTVKPAQGPGSKPSWGREEHLGKYKTLSSRFLPGVKDNHSPSELLPDEQCALVWVELKWHAAIHHTKHNAIFSQNICCLIHRRMNLSSSFPKANLNLLCSN